MKLRHFLTMSVLISFFFVMATQDIYALKNNQEMEMKVKKNSKILSKTESNIQMQLLQSDFILENEDGGGIKGRKKAYLIAAVIIIVCVIIAIYIATLPTSDTWVITWSRI